MCRVAQGRPIVDAVNVDGVDAVLSARRRDDENRSSRERTFLSRQ
jgi:hypothetical protein